jgi:phosphatidylglycerophosphate synthase
MSLPGVIIHESEGGLLPVAGLAVIDRLLIALHRGGCSPLLIVGKTPAACLRRSSALRIEVTRLKEPPMLEGPLLIAASDVLVTAVDIRRLREKAGRLCLEDGALLPAGVAPRLSRSLDDALRNAPRLRAEGVAAVVRNEAERKRAETAFWNTLGTPADGLVDRYLHRPLARRLSARLVPTPITPNQVTVLSMLIGLAAAVLFASGCRLQAVSAALLFQLSSFIDCIDGYMARAGFKESRSGKWLDLAGDQVVHGALFAGIAIGVLRSGSTAPAGALGVAAVLGVAISFAVVLDGHLGGRQGSRLQWLTERMANRDFSIALLALAGIGRLDLFLWAAVIGVHLFWMLAIAARSMDRVSRRRSLAP